MQPKKKKETSETIQYLCSGNKDLKQSCSENQSEIINKTLKNKRP